MRILIYVPGTVVDGGVGSSIHVRELGENLSRLGYEVDLACRLARRTYTGSARIKRVRSPDIAVVGWLWANICGLFLGLVATRTARYDVLYTRAGFSAAAWVISRWAGVPYVTEVNGLIWEEARVSWVGWWRKAFGYFQDWIEGKAYKHSQRIVAVTPRIKEVLVAEYGIEKDKIAVVENGANTDLFTPTDTDEARRRANLSGADHFVTFVGNLLQWQGVEYLIRSVPYVLEEFPTTRFLIVGGGTTKPALVDLARGIGVSDSVIFTEVVPYENVPMYLNASEICVAPFIRGRNERSGVSPLKIHEYGACGKAVVASRLPGLEFVEQCQTGLLVQPESAEELARAIVKLLRDPELRKRMGENGRKYVVENRSWESVAIGVAAVSREAMEDHKAKKNRRKP